MEPSFTIGQARQLVPTLREHVERLTVLRADLADAHVALQRGEQPAGGLPEAKALEARLQEAVDWFERRGIQLKGIAPVIADFPSDFGGAQVLLCWLEGETSLDWYHGPELGFMGRRRLPNTAG